MPQTVIILTEHLGQVVLVLQRQLWSIGDRLVIEHVEDLLPDAGGAPLGITAVHGFPGTKVIGEFSPGAASADDPKDAREDQPVVGIRASSLGLLWWEQGRNAVPVLIGQLELACVQPLDRGRPERWCLLLGSASGVASPGTCLVAPAKGRPAESELEVLEWFGDGDEQPTNLGDGQWEEVCWPPFSSTVAWRRVTSR
jgi:hypothetical protein